MTVRILSLLFFAVASFAEIAYSVEPTDCVLNTSSINSLVKCLQNFIIRNKTDNTDLELFQQQPTVAQREAWSSLIAQLLNSEENCTEIKLHPSLQGIYAIEKFTDDSTLYCVLYELKLVELQFAKGWGIFIVPYSSNYTRLGMVHLSAAHPFTDGSVHLEAANIFKKTRAKSLLISGTARNASNEKSSCDKKYMKFDGAHDNFTMFHSANLAIIKWQLNQSQGCPWRKCSFIQFHGKAKTSCNKTSVFLSTGLGRSSEALAFYKNKSLPIQRLKSRLRKLFSKKFTINTPLEDKSCKLTAGSNIFGRVLNGVPIGKECKLSANATTASGYFIHVEQSSQARKRSAYNVWAKAIIKVFQ